MAAEEPEIERTDHLTSITDKELRPDKLAASAMEQYVNKSQQGSSSSTHSNDVIPRKKSYDCTQCSRSFYTKDNRTSHEKLHIELKCQSCNDIFNLRSELIAHVRQQHRISHTCEYCKKTFKAYSVLEQHILTRTKEKRFNCSQCSEAFSVNGSLKMHNKSVHQKEKSRECEFCKRAFATNGELTAHNRTHTGEKPYHCKYCPRDFPISWSLKRHERTHTGEKKHRCLYCNKIFAEAEYLKAHIMGVHTTENIYKCRHPGCVSSFSRNSTRYTHEKLHNPIKQFACGGCSKEFRNKAHLGSHMASTHKLANSYDCSYCQKVIYGQRNLKDHERNHTCPKKFQCEVCPAKFNGKAMLERHVSGVHRDERRFSCSICEKLFSRADAVMSHNRLVHAGEKTYSCEYCGKAVKSSSTLKVHIRIHTKERPYNCTPCNQTFSSSRGLRKHQGTKTHKSTVLNHSVN